jgi:hypothetical protein
MVWPPFPMHDLLRWLPALDEHVVRSIRTEPSVARDCHVSVSTVD